MSSFDEWFQRATGNDPFPFQWRFAAESEIPQLVDVPTGLGKTAMAVLGWLWRRRFADEETRKAMPRRLVYCLPMRVLVEQTRDNAVLWLHNIELLAGTAEFEEKNDGKRLRSYRPDSTDSTGPNKVAVHVLMGGEDEEDWDIHPEREQIIIGTQDMLLSRALNRGYAATRSRWPIQFGLLNTNCLWVFDEIQLMGAGLATTAQLEAFRHLLPDKDAEATKISHGCRTVWMSATMQRDWLKTVDFSSFFDHAPDKQRNAFGQIVAPGFWRRYDWVPKEGRRHFRHELASALSVLDPRNDKIPDELRDLVAYLVAAHHGKVRLSIRSLPNELHPDGNRRFARGIWDDDELPATQLGGDIIAPAVRLSLEPMELGLCEQEPFTGRPSWAERMIRLRDALGPFRLAYLEAILRAADMRVSRAAEKRSLQAPVVEEAAP